MPSPKSSNHWTFSEFLGQRKLLGFGALLAWLFLFHLLVNVWLLCIFTSLLVVLGGWLGSRAALDANSLLHLEHFLPLGEAQPAPPSPEQERRLDREIHRVVHKAVRDFVSSWYRTLLPEEQGEFERAVRGCMLQSVMELKRRAQLVDRRALIQRVLELYGYHLQSYMAAKEMQAKATLAQKDSLLSLWQLYSKVDTPHPALSSATCELGYSRALVNLVLHVLVPYPHMETRTGGYMVVELVTCNVLLPLISRVSEPDWLNQAIVDIFTKSREPQEAREVSLDELSAAAIYPTQKQRESWTTCCSLPSEWASFPSGTDLSEQCNKSPVCKGDSSQRSTESLASTVQSETCRAQPLTPCRLSRFNPDTDNPESKQLSPESQIETDSEDNQAEGFCNCAPPTTNLCSALMFTDDVSPGCMGALRVLTSKQPVVSEDTHCLSGMAQDPSEACPPRGVCLNYNVEHPSSPGRYVSIQNVHIAGTVTAKDLRGTALHPYTLYIIKYEILVYTESLGTLKPVAYHTVNRRYNEFLTLQSRLEEKLELKKYIKNIRGPKKLFPDLSFGNADIEKVEIRKSQLDSYIQQLSSIPEITNSEDMREFLALNTHADCSLFERKPSMIDKMMVNALDTLKTAFPRSDPQSPTEHLEGEPEARAVDNRKHSIRRLRFPSKIGPSLTIPDLEPKVTYCFSEGSAILNGMSPSGLEMFIEEQERLLCKLDEKEIKDVNWYCETRRFSGKPSGTDTAVADVVLNILCLLMKDQWSWLCTENIQKTIRLLFGTFIERWLDVGMAHLTSTSCWVIYLQVLQEAMWPGGMLPAQPRPERSAAQKGESKTQCLDCLTQLLPDLVTDMLDAEKYSLSLETMMDSLQDHQINKHLVYCICDLLLEFLIPESTDETFQKLLLHRLSKVVESETPQP